VLDEPDQPVVADRVEERPEVGVEDPVDPLPGDPGGERVQRVVLTTPGPEPVAEAEELRLIDRGENATTAVWTILSSSAAMPSGRCPPSGLGMYRRRDGSAR
jgi:hypothetical protein